MLFFCASIPAWIVIVPHSGSVSMWNSPFREAFLAAERNTDPRQLELSTMDVRSDVRLAAVRNSHTPEVVLNMLSVDPDSMVRAAVASRTWSREVLRTLSKDRNINVRRAVATNVRTPRGILTAWKRNEDGELAQRAIGTLYILSRAV